MLQSANNKNLRFNYIVNLLDGAFFGMGIGFSSFSTILPLFVSSLTDSALIIGMIPAIHNACIMLPQLFSARWLHRSITFKPAALKGTIHERLPFLGLALISWFIPIIGKPLALALVILMLIWQGLGAGFTGNPWQNMLGRVIPSNMIATFMGFQAASANLLASGSAVVAGIILERLESPFDFSLNFTLCFAILMISYYCLSLTREPERDIESLPHADTSLSKTILDIFRRDRPFRWFIITRNLYQFGTMAFAFYIVYAVRRHGMNEATAGIMTSVLLISQTVANPLLGWLADRWGRRKIFIGGASAAFLSALLAFFLPGPDFFFVTFILAAFANTTFWTIGMAYTLDFGTEIERPTYVGMANTLIAPSAILAPLFGGWLADGLGYQFTFIFAAGCSVLTVLVLRFFVTEPRSTRPGIV